MKKILAITLALVMVMSLSVVAFADTPGSITIKGTEAGTTYNLYKVFDLTGADTDEDDVLDAVAYTIDPDWLTFFTGVGAPGAAYIVAEQPTDGNLNTVIIDGETNFINITDDNVVDFANAASAWALDNLSEKIDATATGTGSDVDVEDLALGYYVVLPLDASVETGASLGSIASLTSTVPSAEVAIKAVKPSIAKTDDKATVDVGTTVNYTITGICPNTAGYSDYTYIITDTMSEGLTFNKDVAVKIGADELDEALWSVDYTTANKFVLTIDVMDETVQDMANETITVTYSAIVNDAAVGHDQETNSCTLTYGAAPATATDKLTTTTPIEEEVYTAQIFINKYTGADKDDADQKLADAQFVLMNAEGKVYKYTAKVEADGENPEVPAKVEWITVSDAPAIDATNITDAQITALTGSEATIKTTNDTGAASFDGIADGTYYLVEVAAPDGYNRLIAPVTVEVTGNDVDVDATHVEGTANSTGDFDAAVSPTADVQNNSGSVLPSTGGIGTTIFYVVGSLLAVGAGVLLVAKKRMTANG